MNSNALYVAIDRSRLRVYRSSTYEGTGANGRWAVVESVDYPGGRTDYFDTATDDAGRFPTAQGPGMSIDERLPMKEEHERRLVSELAASLERCLAENPDVSWHFAAGPGLYQAVARQLSPQVKARMGRSLERNLAKLSPDELRAHFDSA